MAQQALDAFLGCSAFGLQDAVIAYPFAATTIDAAGEKHAQVFRASKTGNIAKVGILINAASDPQALQVSVQSTTGTAPASPDGTILGATAGALGAIATPAATTFFKVTLGEVAPVVKGTVYGVVTEFSGTVGNVQVARGPTMGISPYDAYGRAYVSSYGAGGQANVLYVEYDDGSTAYMPGSYPFGGGSASRSAVLGAAVERMGYRMRFPNAVKIGGVWAYIEADNDCDFVVYNDAGTALATASGVHLSRYAAAQGLHRLLFDGGAIDVAADTWIRVVVKANGASVVLYAAPTIPDADCHRAYPLGVNCHGTTFDGTGAGVWDDTTYLLTRLPIGPLIAGGDDAAGGSGDYPDVENVTTDDTTNGAAGTLTLPAVEDVEDGVTYGGDGTEFEGTLEVTPAAESGPSSWKGGWV